MAAVKGMSEACMDDSPAGELTGDVIPVANGKFIPPGAQKTVHLPIPPVRDRKAGSIGIGVLSE
jgi:hypothetical protein